MSDHAEDRLLPTSILVLLELSTGILTVLALVSYPVSLLATIGSIFTQMLTLSRCVIIFKKPKISLPR